MPGYEDQKKEIGLVEALEADRRRNRGDPVLGH
jgi:hypothetical protein